MEPSSMSRGRRSSPQRDGDLAPEVRTTKPTELQGHTIYGTHRKQGHGYEPTPYRILERLFSSLPIDHQRFHFVDLGSGKGRTICAAARYPWKSVTGVEFSRELHTIAEENLSALPARLRRCHRVASKWSDAADFEFPNAPTVIFMFNPFSAKLLAKVVENLRRAHESRATERWIVYYFPVHARVLRQAAFLERVSNEENWAVFRTTRTRRHRP